MFVGGKSGTGLFDLIWSQEYAVAIAKEMYKYLKKLGYYCNSIFLRPYQVKKSCIIFPSDKHLSHIRYHMLNIKKITKFFFNISKGLRQIKNVSDKSCLY